MPQYEVRTALPRIREVRCDHGGHRDATALRDLMGANSGELDNLTNKQGLVK